MTRDDDLDPAIQVFLDRFPEYEAIALTISQRRDFKSLCEDYVAALDAREAWSGKPDAAHQFWCIAMELEEEIIQKLVAAGSE